MKKSLILGILSLAAATVTTFGQGTIWLDNYDSAAHPLVTYGANTDGTAGSAVLGAGNYVAGLYWVAGNQVGSFAADPSGHADPTSLFSGVGTLNLASGTGATGGIGNSDTGTPGEYAPPNAFNPGLGQGATVTVMVIAYNNGSYANASDRGHSLAFTMTTSSGTATPPFSGDFQSGGFSVLPVPEPSIFALSGLGAAALMLIRRKK